MTVLHLTIIPYLFHLQLIVAHFSTNIKIFDLSHYIDFIHLNIAKYYLNDIS